MLSCVTAGFATPGVLALSGKARTYAVCDKSMARATARKIRMRSPQCEVGGRTYYTPLKRANQTAKRSGSPAKNIEKEAAGSSSPVCAALEHLGSEKTTLRKAE